MAIGGRLARMSTTGEAGWPASQAEWIGYQSLGPGRARIDVQPAHIAPNGFLQAGVMVALADMVCAPFHVLPEGVGFTTVELKINLLGTARVGDGVLCEATMQHGGRTTQVWDAVITNETSGKKMALFRCTQLLLYGNKDERR
jgi:uncharacterized protein (TIGR00369 family)